MQGKHYRVKYGVETCASTTSELDETPVPVYAVSYEVSLRVVYLSACSSSLPTYRKNSQVSYLTVFASLCPKSSP